MILAMKRSGPSHAARVAGGKARARTGKRGPNGRFVGTGVSGARALAHRTSGTKRYARHKQVIAITEGELEHLRRQAGVLRRTPTSTRRPKFMRRRQKKMFARKYEVVKLENVPRLNRPIRRLRPWPYESDTVE